MIFLSLLPVNGWSQRKPPFTNPPILQKVKLYGPGLPNRTFTFNDFQYIRNSKNTPNFSDIRTSTVLIQTELGPTETATWFLDIGDNDGSVGKNAFRIMVAFLDPSGQQSSYRAIDVYNETRTQIMTSSLGRNRWQSMFWTRWIHLFYYLFTL